MGNLKAKFINTFKVTIEALSDLPLDENSHAYEDLLKAERMLMLLKEKINEDITIYR